MASQAAVEEQVRVSRHSINGTVQRVAGMPLGGLIAVIVLSVLVVGGLPSYWFWKRRRQKVKRMLTHMRLLSRARVRVGSSTSRLPGGSPGNGAMPKDSGDADGAGDDDDPLIQTLKFFSMSNLISTCVLACFAMCAFPCLLYRKRRDDSHQRLGADTLPSARNGDAAGGTPPNDDVSPATGSRSGAARGAIAVAMGSAAKAAAARALGTRNAARRSVEAPPDDYTAAAAEPSAVTFFEQMGHPEAHASAMEGGR